MNKKIVSIFLLALLVVSFAVPAYADSEEFSTFEIPETDPQVQAVNDAIERLDISANDISVETVAEALEAEGISASNDIFAYVYDFAGLETALADPDVSIILLLADIQMNYALTINKDVSMSGVLGSVITSSGTSRHFNILEQDGITLTFSNVILDGGNSTGGIYVGVTSYIKGAVIQNCSSTYGSAVSTVNMIATSLPLDREELMEITPFEDTQINNYAVKASISQPYLILENCTITNNTASRWGGGIYTTEPTAIMNCDISHNNASYGGGVYSQYLVVENSSITNNTASTYGGGVCAILVNGTTVIRDTEVMYNHAKGGGGLYLASNDNYLENTVISYNTAESGGGIRTSTSGPQFISGGIVENNTADTGGGLYLTPSDTFDEDGSIIARGFAELSDMQIKDNHAISGGGISIWYSVYDKVTVSEDVIFSGNTADKGYYITDEEDIAIHDSHVFTTHFSAPFTQYAYNNFDISYEKGEELSL